MMSDRDDPATSDDRVDGLRSSRASGDTSGQEPLRPEDDPTGPVGYIGGGVTDEMPSAEEDARTSSSMSDPKVGDVLATGSSPEGDEPDGMQERTQAL